MYLQSVVSILLDIIRLLGGLVVMMNMAYYTGSTETFRRVVEATSEVPVLMSGDAKTKTPLEFLKVVKSVMDAGASGVVVGRNIFQSKDPHGMAKAIMAVVHEGLEPEEALKLVEA